MDNNLKIINYLGKHLTNSFTMLEFSKLIKLPYATFYRTIQKMQNIINIKQIGKSKVISLNIHYPIIKSYLIISSEEEKAEYLKKQPIIKKITQELNTKDTVILFGSYAKGTEKESSDIDLLIIGKPISFSKYEIFFKKKINPIVITKSEFTKMLKDEEENVGKQALKEHIILNNPEEFWGGVLNG